MLSYIMHRVIKVAIVRGSACIPMYAYSALPLSVAVTFMTECAYQCMLIVREHMQS